MRHTHREAIVQAVLLLLLCLFSFGFSELDATDWYTQGMDSFGQQLYGDAVDAFSKAIGADPLYEQAYVQRGTAYIHLQEYDLAINDLTQAIALKPDDDEAYFSRGLAHVLSGDYESAVNDFSRTINIRPGRDDAYFERGAIYEKMGQFDNAGRDLNTACEMGNDTACEAYDTFKQRMIDSGYGAP